MSFTEAEHVFAGINEDGLNDILTAVFTTRPHYIPVRVPPVRPVHDGCGHRDGHPPLPRHPRGYPVGSLVRGPKDRSVPRQLGRHAATAQPRPGRSFSLRTEVTLYLLCGGKRKGDSDRRDWTGNTLKASLGVWATGRLLVSAFGGGSGEIRFNVDAVELVDVKPDPLETLLECLIRMLLTAAIKQVVIPFESLRAGASR